ncbi:fibroblast growth factor receptor 1-A [Aplysia californica]|uniref:Fibroblast growth factor receptor 1-A n=1 Tax=Aplysia californica TaxID=6500 RepID=A0ABM0JID5_APLCA|nr:fibroblast growth factor receptor 1-A [Aplysia californica]
MRLDYFCLLVLLVSSAILVTARKGRKKKDRKQRPQWKSSSMPAKNTRFETIHEGKDLAFDCKAQGRPKPSVTWLKDGNPLMADDRTEIKKAGVLKLKSVTTQNSGNYTCMVSNNHGQLEWTFHLDVQGEVKIWPLVVEGPNNITQMVGSSVAFRCRVLNDPTATIRWQRVGLKTGDDDAQPEFMPDGDDPQVLALQNIQKEDEGEYRCMAGNVWGLKHSKAWLHVIEPVLIPDMTGTDRNPNLYNPVDSDPPERGTYDFGPDLFFTTTRRPRNRNKGRKNGRRKNKNKHLDISVDKGKDKPDDVFSFQPTTKPTTTVATTTVTPEVTERTQPVTNRPDIWEFEDRNNYYDGVPDSRYYPAKDKDDDEMDVVTGRSEQDKTPKGTISSWTIYTIVGAVGGVVLLVGLIAITLTLCCKKEEGGVYKSTPV